MGRQAHKNKVTGEYRIWNDNSESYVTPEIDEAGVRHYFQMRILTDAISQVFKEQKCPINPEVVNDWGVEREEESSPIQEWQKPMIAEMRRNQRLAELFFEAIKEEVLNHAN